MFAIKKSLPLIIFLQNLFLLFYLNFAFATGGAGLNYQGRLIDPSGKAVVGSSVKFKLQIRSPGNENCLLYEEEQTKDLSQADGVYSLSINDGTGTRTDSSSYSIDQIFANRGTLTFPSGSCALGNTYSPSQYDGRKIQMLFNDGTFAAGTWESGPIMAISFVPTAIEALQLSGYKKEQVLKLADGVSTTGSELNSTQWTDFLALINGTSNKYLKPTDSAAKLQGAAIPTVANGESIRWNSSLGGGSGGWEVFTPGASVSVTSVVAGSGLLVGATPGASITTTGTLNIDTGTSANKILKLDSSAKIPAVDGSLLTNINASSLQGTAVSSTTPNLAGQVLRFNGTNWVPGVVAMTDLRSSTTGLSAFTSNCASNQTLTYNSVGDIMSCSSISINGNQVTQGTIDINHGGTGATTQAGAANAILPSQTSNSGKYLTTDGTNVSWGAASSQWNDGASSSINYTAGNVGIGTTTPSQALDVAGNISSTGYFFDSASMSMLSGGGQQATVSGWYGIQLRGSIEGSPNSAASNVRGAAQSAHVAIPMMRDTGFDNATNIPGLLIYGKSSQTADYFQIGSNGTTIGQGGDVFVVKASGNVGIGTTNPSASLDIIGNNGTAGSPNGTAGINVTAGNAYSSSNGTGGGISLRAGQGAGTGPGGNVTISAGQAGVTGGSLTLYGGGSWYAQTAGSPYLSLNGSGSSSAGSVVLSSGSTNGSAPGMGGNVTIQTPSTTTGFTANAGNISIVAGSGESAGTGGAVTITAGGGGSTNINGSNVVINGGVKGGSGSDGNVILANSRGKVGIGTSNPTSLLTVNGDVSIGTGIIKMSSSDSSIENGINNTINPSGSHTNLIVMGSGNFVGNSQPINDSIVFGIGNSMNFRRSIALGRLNNNGMAEGSVTVGISNSATVDNGIALGISNTANSGIAIGASNTTSDGIAIGKNINNTISGALQIGPNDSSKVTIDSVGNVGVGTTSLSYKLEVNGDVNIASANVLRFGGTQVCASAGCTATSDRSLKENILPLQNSIDNILKLQGVSYDWKNKTKFGYGNQVGLIAQDLEKVYPQVVITDPKSGLKSVAYDHLIAPLIEAFKELFKISEKQSETISILEENNSSREREIASLKLEIVKAKEEAQQAIIRSEKAEKENEAIKIRIEKIEKLLQVK